MASHPNTKRNGFRLLSALDLLVAGDIRQPGFTGRLAVAVHADAGTLWWVADFGHQAKTAFADNEPADATFTLQLDATDAEQVMHRGTLPHDMGGVAFDGDATVFDRFVARYLTKHDALTVRMQGRAR